MKTQNELTTEYQKLKAAKIANDLAKIADDLAKYQAKKVAISMYFELMTDDQYLEEMQDKYGYATALIVALSEIRIAEKNNIIKNYKN